MTADANFEQFTTNLISTDDPRADAIYGGLSAGIIHQAILDYSALRSAGVIKDEGRIAKQTDCGHWRFLNLDRLTRKEAKALTEWFYEPFFESMALSLRIKPEAIRYRLGLPEKE